MTAKLRNMTSLYLVNGEGILLLYRIGSRVADHLYVGSAGGHFEAHELNDAKACVLREAKEELDLDETDLHNLAMRYITLRLKNGEIRQNYYFFADLGSHADLTSTEGKLALFDYEEAAQVEMPVSARNVVDHYIRKGKYTAELYAGITTEQGTSFVPLHEF